MTAAQLIADRDVSGSGPAACDWSNAWLAYDSRRFMSVKTREIDADLDAIRALALPGRWAAYGRQGGWQNGAVDTRRWTAAFGLTRVP